MTLEINEHKTKGGKEYLIDILNVYSILIIFPCVNKHLCTGITYEKLGIEISKEKFESILTVYSGIRMAKLNGENTLIRLV